MVNIKIILLLLMLPVATAAQKYCIVDPSFKSSVLYSDSVSYQQYEKGFIPLDANKVDSILIFLEGVAQRLERVTFNKFYSMKWKAGLTSITVTMDRQAYGDKYNVILHTETGNNPDFSVPIITSWEANGDTRRNLKKFIEFVRSNQKN